MTLSNRALLAASSQPYRPAWAEGVRAMSVRKSGSLEYGRRGVLADRAPLGRRLGTTPVGRRGSD